MSQEDERIARKLLDLTSRGDRVQIRNGMTYLDGFALGNGTVEIRSQVVRDRRMRMVEAQEMPLSANFVAIFKRRSDSRLFVHPALDTTDPSAVWSVENFIDTGVLTPGGVLAFVAANSNGTGWQGWDSFNPLGYFSDTGNGQLQKSAFDAAAGVELNFELFASELRIGSAHWGQFRARLDVEDSLDTLYRFTYSRSGPLTFNSLPGESSNGYLIEPNFYALPTVEMPFPEQPDKVGNNGSVLVSNANNSISLFRYNSAVYIARAGQGYEPLMAGEGALDPLTNLFVNRGNWLYGDILISRTVGLGNRPGAIYKITGNTISLLEPRTMRLPSGLLGYSLISFFVTPARPA